MKSFEYIGVFLTWVVGFCAYLFGTLNLTPKPKAILLISFMTLHAIVLHTILD